MIKVQLEKPVTADRYLKVTQVLMDIGLINNHREDNKDHYLVYFQNPLNWTLEEIRQHICEPLNISHLALSKVSIY